MQICSDFWGPSDLEAQDFGPILGPMFIIQP